MAEDRIRAHYLLESPAPVQEVAETMAGEQSAGTFVQVPGESAALQERVGARVERAEELERVPEPGLPGAYGDASGGYIRARIVLSFPLEAIGTSIIGLLTAVAGNLYELAPVSGLKLEDLELPQSFTDAQLGPGFGIRGTRERAGVFGRPLIGTIIKPSVGLSPDETAVLVERLCRAGVDFIKDDELQSDSPHSAFDERVRAVTRVLEEHAQRSDKKVMYAFNVSGEIDDMLRRHDLVVRHGGTCVMVNMLMVGLAGIQRLRRHSQVPIHGHRAGWGILSRHPVLGIDYVALQQVLRLAGVDHLHVNGLRNKFSEPGESVIASARACLRPLNGRHVSMPVFSSGQTAARLPDTYDALGSRDFLFLAGGGIMAHPGGAEGGVESLRQAWQAAEAGIPLRRYAEGRTELRQALERFGD